MVNYMKKYNLFAATRLNHKSYNKFPYIQYIKNVTMYNRKQLPQNHPMTMSKPLKIQTVNNQSINKKEKNNFTTPHQKPDTERYKTIQNDTYLPAGWQNSTNT